MLVGEVVVVAGEAAEEVGAAEIKVGVGICGLKLGERGAEMVPAVGGRRMGAEEVGE